MTDRVLAPEDKPGPFFESGPATATDAAGTKDEGIRDMRPLAPFIISGGTNTERYYFTHINKKTDYKFNIKPQYFSDESNYTESFPKRIREILSSNPDARIFCVFDWDTIRGNAKRLEKHRKFEKTFSKEIANGSVTICQSMPSIEYWFLLHFENYTGLLKRYSNASGRVAPYLKPCFPDPTIKLKKLLKREELLEDSTWVINLCADGKLEKAIKTAEENVLKAIAEGDLENQSYTYVYKAFKASNTLSEK